MTRSQFQPYRAGCVLRPLRLALNTTAVTTAVTAAMEPSSAERTGTARTPAPGSNALRVPTTAAAGSPAAAAARATADEPTPAPLARGRTDRTARTASRPTRARQNTAAPAPRTSPSALIPRSGSNRRTGPTGASGDIAIAPATASAAPPRTGITPGSAAASAAWPRVAPSTRSTAMSGADRPIIWARPCPTSTSMASAAIAPNTLSATASGLIACCTWLRMTSVRLIAERGRAHVAVRRLLLLPLQVRGQRGQLPLQLRNPGRAPGQPQPDPRVEVLRQQLPGRPRRQDGPLRLVGLVHQRGRDLRDRRHPVGPDEGRARRAGPARLSGGTSS